MELETAVRVKLNRVYIVWIDGTYDMVGVEERAKYKRTSGADFGPVDVVKYAGAFCAKGLIHTNPAKLRGAALHGNRPSRRQARDRGGAL